MSDNIDTLSQSPTNEKKISPAMKCWFKNKANEYPCPDCGTTINKSNRSRHNKSQKHRLAVLTNLMEKNKL